MNRVKPLLRDFVFACRSMSGTYSLFRFCAKQWTWLMLILISLTIGIGLLGFNDGKYDYLTRFYLVVLLFPLNNGEVTGNVANWSVEVARWLGVVVWFSTVATVLIKLFADRVLEWFVHFTAKDHTIIAGLGKHGHELVERLLDVKKDGKWENVIVLARDATNSQLDACRDKGAVVLIGDPASDRLLDIACLKEAKRLLVLFEEDQETLQVITEAFRLLQPSDTGEDNPRRKVYCVAEVTEPGLQEVINQHELNLNETDFFSINTINLYEVCTRSMLSRARWHSKTGELSQIAIVGLGEKFRLAETLILRIAKDQLIDSSSSIEIHLYDLEAERFASELLARFPFLMQACELKVHSCSSERCGIGCDDPKLGICQEAFDAAFICIEDESKAAVQATKIGKLIHPAPVVVRTEDSRNGLGALLRRPNAGGLGENIIAIGFQDIILDPEMALRPKQEMIAQACHEGYLHSIRQQISEAEKKSDVQETATLRSKSANVPWDQLTEHDRVSNRESVRFYSRHLERIDSERKPTAYGIFEQVSGHLSEAPPALKVFSQEEIEFLAEGEHERWMQFMYKAGWKVGPKKDNDKKLHHCLVPYDQLKETDKEYDRDVFRNLPTILARANIFIKPIDQRRESAAEA